MDDIHLFKTTQYQLTTVIYLLISCLLMVEAVNVIGKDRVEEKTDLIGATVKVLCNSESITLRINNENGFFTGMVYPKGLTNRKVCLRKWNQALTPIEYSLPLRGCNTMSTDLEISTGGVEYFNTIVIEPHIKLLTNYGKDFPVYCRYNTSTTITYPPQQNIISSSIDLLASNATIIRQNSSIIAKKTSLPVCIMKIFNNGDGKASTSGAASTERVKIGDPLTMMITLMDQRDQFGLKVTDCIVRDGIGWGEQKLINDLGCPINPDIMGYFEYTEDNTKASVKFQAHKFPYTTSVYYQCNIQLYSKKNTSSSTILQGHINDVLLQLPSPSSCKANIKRHSLDDELSNSNSDGIKAKRQIEKPTAIVREASPATIEVYRGLFVNEANDILKDNSDDSSLVYKQNVYDETICITQQSFAIGVCIAGIFLVLMAIAALIFLLARRNKRKVNGSNPSSSIYSGPYTSNTMYSHSS